MKTVDLHTHTTASDGSFSPKDLVDYAVKKNLAAIAITDHDTMDGIQEAMNYICTSRLSLELIPGMEVSSSFSGCPYGIHVLAFFIDKNEEILADIIKKVRIELGRNRISTEDAIKYILNLGGIPVLAHPKDCFLSMEKLDSLVEKLASYGLKGMECIYTTHSNLEIKQFKEIASRHNLLITGGTDFHGLRKPDTELGSGYGNLSIPYDLVESLKNTTIAKG